MEVALPCFKWATRVRIPLSTSDMGQGVTLRLCGMLMADVFWQTGVRGWSRVAVQTFSGVEGNFATLIEQLKERTVRGSSIIST